MFVAHGERFEVAPQWASELEGLGLVAGADWYSSAPGQVISASATSACSVVRVASGEALYVKQARYPFARQLKTWLRPAKTTVEAFAYNCLNTLGVPTLESIALAEKRCCGLLRASLIVTRGVPASVDLLEYSETVWPDLGEDERRAAYLDIAEQLAEQLRVAHDFGFVHHDLKWRNVLLHRPSDRWIPLWIDPPRAAVWGRHRRERISVIDLSDLARMSVPLTSVYDRARFLARYLGSERRPGDLKRLYRLVADRVQRRIDRDATSAKRQDRAV